jgi:hypothetical protein
VNTLHKGDDDDDDNNNNNSDNNSSYPTTLSWVVCLAAKRNVTFCRGKIFQTASRKLTDIENT